MKRMFSSLCACVVFSAFLLISFASPVRMDSLTRRSFSSRSMQSAGIFSPLRRRMISPGTRCVALISCSLPSRMTMETGMSRDRNAFIAFSARYS